jgi:long-subunit acyl-CoA synthetase (AMP-forming)
MGRVVADIKGITALESGDDVGAILYTGGATGTPKGAVLTHRNLIASAGNVAFYERMTPDDIGVCFMPLNHVFCSMPHHDRGFTHKAGS